MIGPDEIPLVDDPDEARANPELAMLPGLFQIGGSFEATFARGRAAGEINAILVVLATRGIDISDEHRDRSSTCTDLAQLDKWLARAATATSIQDVFG